MPGTSRAPKRARAPRRKRRAADAAASLDKVRALTLDMEEPLDDLENLTQALRFIGHGMEAWHDEKGRPISSLAWSAVQRLDALRGLWRGIHKAARGRGASKLERDAR